MHGRAMELHSGIEQRPERLFLDAKRESPQSDEWLRVRAKEWADRRAEAMDASKVRSATPRSPAA
jgi:hypothetical protein